MGLQYRIFYADNTGQSGAGGPPSTIEADSIIPAGMVSPYRGQGDRFIYRKMFLQITEFSAQTGLPQISDVSVLGVTTTSGRVVFTLNEPCITELRYGTNPESYGTTVNIGGTAYLSGTQTGYMTPLTENSLYHYKINAVDLDDNPTTYLGSFNTLDGTAPVFLGGPQLSNLTASGVTVRWNTNEASTSKVRYGLTASLGTDSTYDTALVTAHSVGLTGLTANTQYWYAPVSVDSAGNSGQFSPTLRFLTLETTEGNPALTITSTNDATATTSGATVTFYTNNPSDTTIYYSTSLQDLTGQTGQSGLIVNVLSYYSGVTVTGHTGVITNCAPGFTYYYKVQAHDIYGQTLVDPTGLSTYSFTTTNTNQVPNVFFSGVTPSSSGAVISFITDILATGIIGYGLELGVFPSGQSGNAARTGHVFNVSGLAENTTYYYYVSCVTPEGIRPVSDPIRTFTTTDITPPTITTYSTGGNDTSLTFNWSTAERTSATARLTRVSDSTEYSQVVGGFFTHSATFNNLTASTQYIYYFTATDAFLNTSGVSGYIWTLAAPVGPDTQRPIISNVTHSTTDTTAYVSWITDEDSTSIVEYSETAFPGTTETTVGEVTTNHSVVIDSLTPETTYNFRVKSTDAAGNIATGNTDSFTMDAAPGASNFAIGDTVAWVEWEVPASITSMTSTYIPVRVTVPIQGRGDTVLPWYTEYGHYCQRDEMKWDGGDNPLIVDVIFPIPLSEAVAVGAGNKLTFALIAQADEVAIPWNTYTIPSDLKVSVQMPDGQLATATLDPYQTALANRAYVRGDGASPYSRTVRIYNRCTLQGTVNAYHPETQSLGVHAYITYWNKDWFTDFYPQLDIRISNAHIDTTTPTRRGGVYYKNIQIAYPTQQPDGVDLSLVLDTPYKTTNKGASSLVLVQDPIRCAPNPYPSGGTLCVLGGSIANYNLLYANDTSNHYFFPASTLDFRVALHQKNSASNQIQQKQLARLDHVAYCVLNESEPTTLLSARSWSTCRSFGPQNVYLPTYSSSHVWGSYTGREARNQRCKSTFDVIESNLINGTYIHTTLAGSPPTNYSATNAHPVQFGPYRPWGGEEGGVETGGYAIDPFQGHNHSKWEVLMYLMLNRMMKARHFFTQYTSRGLATTVWDMRVAGGDSTLGLPGPVVNLGWRNGQDVILDSKGTQLLDYVVPVNGQDYIIGPWNAPTVPVTSAHSYSNGEGCSYHDDRTSYGATYEGYPTSYQSYVPNNRNHLHQYKAFDHQHQIKMFGALVALAELTNDSLLKDDLINQAHINTLSMSQYSSSNSSYANGYNLAEIYYGYYRNNGQYQAVGARTQPNQGLSFGRTFAWPLWFIIAAYQLGDSYHRPILLENLNMWGLLCNTAIMPIGCLTRDSIWKLQNNLQHYGISMNGVKAYLRTDSSNWNGGGLTSYNLASTYNATSAQSVDVNLTSSTTPVLVAQWAITTPNYNAGNDSVYSASYDFVNGTPGIRCRINNWLTTWKANMWVQRVAGTGGAQFSIKAFLRNETTGQEYQITDTSTGQNGFTVGANKVNITMNPRQVYAAGLPGGVGQLDTGFSIPFSSFHRLIFRIYATSSGLTGADTNTMRLYMGNADPLVVNTTIESAYGAIYDHNQIFETHMMNSSMVALARNVLSHQSSDTVSTNLLTSVRRFYHDFYSVLPLDLTIPGTQLHSSPWVKYSNGYAESWIIGVAKNANYPPGNDTSPFTTIIAEQGRYSNNPTDWMQYAGWSSYVGMLADDALGLEFSNSLSNTPYTQGYLLDKWSKMGTSHSTPTAHVTFLESLFSDTNNYMAPALAAGTIGHVKYQALVDSAALTVESTQVTAPKVRIFLLDESSPGRVQLAATPYREDRMSGASMLYGSQADAVWLNEDTQVRRPDFRFARGAGDAVVLYNNDGELGGDVVVGTDLSNAVPFWVRYRLDENQNVDEGYLRFGVIAGEGPVGEGGTNNGTVPDEPTEVTLWSDPSGDMVIHLGSERMPATPNSITKTSNTYYFNYNGTEEAIQYVLSFDAGSGNANGVVRMYESTSASWPIYNGGLEYRNTAGTLYTPLTLSGTTTLRPGYPRKSTDGTKVVAEYTNSLDGGRLSRYTFLQTGKCMRVTMEATDLNTNYSGSYYNATIGIASGAETPLSIEIGGAGNVPIVMFNGPSTEKYFWGGFLDPTQSNGQYVYLTYNPTGISSGSNWFTNPMYAPYVGLTNGKINASVSETFTVGISKDSQDLYVKSTSPTSPYREDQAGRYNMLLAASGSSWNSGSASYMNLMRFMTGIYMEDLNIWPFAWWTADPNEIKASPSFAPARDGTNHAAAAAFAKQQGWNFGGYVLYDIIASGEPGFSSGDICGKLTGFYEITTVSDRSGNIYTGYALNTNSAKEYAEDDINTIVSSYGWNMAMHDVETYAMAETYINRFDKRAGAVVKTNSEYIVQQKLLFDAIRRAVDGPLLGEGALSSYSHDAQWLWQGWVDGCYRNICSNHATIGSEASYLPSGNVRCPTRWWNAVDFEWKAIAPQQINQGVSLDGRFWSASDYDVARTQTGGWQFGDMLPYTTGAMDRMRAFRFLWARAPLHITNGYIDGTGNYNSLENLAVDYYLTKGVNERLFASPVETITYLSGSSWSSFDELIKTSRNLQTFCRIPTRIKLEDGFNLYVNPSTGMVAVTLDNGETYNLYQDGFLAKASDFIAFTAAPINAFHVSLTGVISYVNDPGKYTAFYGRNVTGSFDLITTAGNNTRQFKVWNYVHTGTVQSETGVGITYPQLITYPGLI